MMRTIAVISLLLVVLLAGYIIQDAFATQPTVTRSSIRNDQPGARPHPYHVLGYTWSTAIADDDSAVLYAYAGGGPIDVAQYGYNDPTFTLELKTTEEDADSAGQAFVVQVTTAASPGDADWHTVVTNTTDFDSTLKGIATFKLRQYTTATKMRIIVYEDSTLTGGGPGAGANDKDATQTLTARLTLPKH